MKKNLKINSAKLLAGTMIVTSSFAGGGTMDLAKDLGSSIVSSVGSMLEPVEVYASTSEVNIDGFVLEFDSSTGTIVKYVSGEGALNIPEKINGVTVKTIGESAFNNCSSLTSISIPNTVTSIKNYSFQSCSKLTSINIPSSVTEIGSYTFRHCSVLNSINVDSSNSNYASQNGVLFSKDLKTLIACPPGKTGAYTIPNSVTFISEDSFFSCSKITSINIPDTVRNIGKMAFYGCSSLTSIFIPSSVTYIAGSVFRGCSELNSISVDNSNTKYTSQNGVLFSKDLTNIIAYPAKKTGAYTIPNTVTSIKDGAFAQCTNLTSITIPNSVTHIETYAFNRCSGLTSITIPNSVSSIGTWAFAWCTDLASLTMSNSVTYIGMGAFANIDKLKNIHFSGTQSEWNAIDKSTSSIPDNATIHYNPTTSSNNNTSNDTGTFFCPITNTDITYEDSKNGACSFPDTTTTTPSLPFNDVSSSANYYEALKYLVDKGVINGTSDTTFSPNEVMTRATLVVMLYRMEGSPATASATFTDVPSGSWYASAISWAKNIGIVNGTSDTTFSPDDALTKEQVAIIINNYYTSKSYNLSNTKYGTIADSSKTSSWASDSVNKMYQIGILNTDSSNNFNPTSSATRADVAYMLGNLLLKTN